MFYCLLRKISFSISKYFVFNSTGNMWLPSELILNKLLLADSFESPLNVKQISDRFN